MKRRVDLLVQQEGCRFESQLRQHRSVKLACFPNTCVWLPPTEHACQVILENDTEEKIKIILASSCTVMQWHFIHFIVQQDTK